MANADAYDLEGLADTLRRNRDGHRQLHETNGKEVDRVYTQAYAQALHELYLATFGDHGEPLDIYIPDHT